MQPQEARRLTQLEKENAQLKKLLAEEELERETEAGASALAGGGLQRPTHFKLRQARPADGSLTLQRAEHPD